MMYVVIEPGFGITNRKKEMDFHVGEKKKLQDFVNAMLEIDLSAKVLVQADGDELLKIHQHLSGIPLASSMVRVVVWEGEAAKFIVRNLPL